MEDARLLGQSSYIFEVGSGLVIDGEVTFLTGDWQPRGGETIHEQIAATGAPALLLRRYDGRLEPHAPWACEREVSHLYRGLVDVAEVNDLLATEGHSGLRLVDNGQIEPQRHGYHLIPAGCSKANAVATHARARGYAPADCVAMGDSREDLDVAAGGGALLSRGQRGGGRRRLPERRAHGVGDERGVLRGRDRGARRVAMMEGARECWRHFVTEVTIAGELGPARRSNAVARFPAPRRPPAVARVRQHGRPFAGRPSLSRARPPSGRQGRGRVPARPYAVYRGDRSAPAPLSLLPDHRPPIPVYRTKPLDSEDPVDSLAEQAVDAINALAGVHPGARAATPRAPCWRAPSRRRGADSRAAHMRMNRCGSRRASPTGR